MWRCSDGDGIGGSEDVASETAKITSPSARRRSPACRRAVAFCNGSSKGTLAGARPVQLCGYLKTRGATRMCRAWLRRGAKRGNLDRQTTLVNVISHQHEIIVVKGKMKLRWGTRYKTGCTKKSSGFAFWHFVGEKGNHLDAQERMQKENSEFSERRAEDFGDVEGREMEEHCITKIAIVVEQHVRKIACSFPRSQIVLLATKTDLINLIVPRGRPRRRRSERSSAS